MMRSLAVATLALSLIAFGGACDDEDDGGTGGRGGSGGAGGSAGRGGSGGTGGATGGTGGATGGTGGATGGTGGSTGGTGGSTGGTGGGGDAADMASMEGGSETGAEAGGGDAPAVSWTAPCDNPKPGVSAAAFCAQYMTACGFGTAMGRTAENSFADMAACMTRYNTYADPGTGSTGKACAAYHLCVASQTGMMTAHCPHPAQAGGPCSLPAR